MGKTGKPSREDLSAALSPRVLELVIFPTEDCNFRCTYCYELHKPGRMHPETVAGIKKLISRRMDDLQFLRLSWFGGEPLTAKNIVFDVAEFAYSQCQKRGVEFAGDITTNGYLLTMPVMARLASADQKQCFISLAGVGADHDRLRPLACSRGTFDRIWGNLTAIRDSNLDFNINLRLHFGTDVAICESLCGKVNEQFGNDARFQVSLQRIADLGGENTGNFPTISAEKARPIVRRLARLLPDIYVSDLQPRASLICCAARPNTLLIRTDGQISRCACHLNDPRNFVGHLDAEGLLKIEKHRLQPWLKGFENFDSRMLSCPYVAVPPYLWPQNSVVKDGSEALM